MASTRTDEVFEVLTRRPDGHETVHRVRAPSQAAAEKAVGQRLDGDRRGGGVEATARLADGGLTASGAA